MTVLVAVLLGLLLGLVIGALGGGGSILTVPALVFLLGLSAQDATSGSLVIVGVTAAVATVGHARSGQTRWGAGALIALAGVPASVLGTRLSQRVGEDVLLLAFATLMLVAAGGMLIRRRGTGTPAEAARQPAPLAAARAARWRALTAAGLVIGFLTGFLGVGGGFVIVPALVLALHYPMGPAVGTSLLVVALNAAVALAARAGTGSLDWAVIVPLTVAAGAASLGGTLLAHRLPARRLTQGFGVLLVLVAGYVGVQAALGLT
ncbi:MAG: sulfite exporter TauE/SafE family protein [Frankiales bacterium]|nr:sulfite exporter TauE/SafE family protein [Frankiales bacterium]